MYVYGLHAVASLLNNHPERVLKIITSKERPDQKVQQILQQAKKNGISIELASPHTLDKLAQDENHQGIIASCQKMKTYQEHDLEALVQHLQKPALLLILDGVQDPHNLGACLRSADAAGVDAVIAPKDKSVGITSTVSKVASGAAETIPFIQVTNLARTLRWLQENHIWIYGAAGEASKTLYEVDLKNSVALVLGAEGTGLRRLTREHCDDLVKIPMHGSVSSLNVSVATGVCLFEAVRQRRSLPSVEFHAKLK